jgi:hypothetical protein
VCLLYVHKRGKAECEIYLASLFLEVYRYIRVYYLCQWYGTKVAALGFLPLGSFGSPCEMAV